jgi:hypothetical protein
MMTFKVYYLDNYFLTGEYRNKRQARLALAEMIGVSIRYIKAVPV